MGLTQDPKLVAAKVVFIGFLMRTADPGYPTILSLWIEPFIGSFLM